jgi:serine/threonine protein kinase/tetratricopeptide (TPR) repeat protein
MRDLHDLDSLAGAVADGTPLDWDRIEAVAPDERSRSMVRNLRALAAMAGLHRTLDGDEARPREPATLRTPVGSVDRPLRMWGHFALEQHIGAGSFGDVFRAIDTRLDRVVAVKLARSELRDPQATLVEARLLARVRHPNVAQVYGADVFDGQPGLWMEFIEGQTLSAVLHRQGALSEGEAAVVGLDLCRALAAVHGAGLLHRDIKAQNAMRESGGRIVLMDFGGGREMSSRRGAGGDTGTPLYLAPEVLKGEPASARSDVYALGVLLYHLVTREFPVKATDALGLAAAHDGDRRVSVAERRPDLSPRFARVIERATAPDADARYASAGAMAADLADVLNPQPAVVAPAAPSPRRRVGRLVAAAAALAVAAGLIAWGALGGRGAGGTASIESILVLPLADDSRDARQEYLAAGFTNALAEDLGLIRSLRIVTSSQARTHRDADPQALARGVGADGYLQGAIRRSADRLVLSLRLFNTASGAVLWAGTFDRPAHEGLSLNREVAREIADELRVALSAEESRVLSARVSVSARAQDAYLRGWAEYHRLSRDGTLEALRQFEQAIALQPTFAAAHAALSYVHWSLGTTYRVTSRDESRARAEAAALRAMELDPTLASAYAALGQVRFYYDWNWKDAEDLFRRAAELNANVANHRMQYGWLLAALNRFEPALQEMRAAVALEPDDIARRVALATTLYYARRFPGALEEIGRAIALDPNAPVGHLAKARFLAGAGRADEALAEIALARYRSEPAVDAELARIQVHAGEPDEARRLLPALITATGEGRLAKDYLAFVHVALGETDHALALLDTALAERSPTLVWVQVDPRFDPLRSDPRFANILRQMGFQQ